MSKKQQKKKLNASNFKIEALEPRLMMDANVDYNDFVNEISDYNYASALSSTLSEMQQNVDQSFTEALGKLNLANVSSVQDFFEDNISNVSTTVESALNEVDDLRLSGLGLNESLDSASAYFSGVGSNIRSLVSTAFENYRDALPDGTTSVPLAALVSGLNTNLPDQLPSNIGNPVFSAPNNDTLKLDFDALAA